MQIAPVQSQKYKLYCTGCGTCAGICPTEFLAMSFSSDGVYRPTGIDNRTCSDCGMCTKVCPGIVWDLPLNNKEQPDDLLHSDKLGEYVSCYAGFANDDTIRRNASSGGIVTAILLDLLENKIIDGAIVVRTKQSHPLCAEMFIARTKEEILAASKSKYIPVNLEGALKSMRMHSNQRYAMVGLPCHIQGIRKAQLLGFHGNKQIVLTIGLFCGHGASVELTRFIMKKYCVAEDDLIHVEYRSGRWPNYGYLFKTENSHVFIPFKKSAIETAWCYNFFTPKRCLICRDLTAESADISCGDAWLPEFTDNNDNSKGGWSVLICRNKNWEKYLDNCNKEGRLNLQRLQSEKVERSQRSALISKKILAVKREKILYGKSENCFEDNHSFIFYIRALSQCMHIGLAHYLNERSILEKIPDIVLFYYFRLLSRLKMV
jgi:coenzyme F420 hydrogenase subunit beta